MRNWFEVRNNHYDEDENARIIEGYYTPFYTEEPTVIAKVNECTGVVTYTDEYKEDDILVKKVINEREQENTRGYIMYACTYKEETNKYHIVEAKVRGILDEYSGVVTLRGAGGSLFKQDMVTSTPDSDGLCYITESALPEDTIKEIFSQEIKKRLRRKIAYCEYRLQGDIEF